MDTDRADAAAKGAEGGAIAALTTAAPTAELDGGGRGGGGGENGEWSRERGSYFITSLPLCLLVHVARRRGARNFRSPDFSHRLDATDGR